MAYTKGHYNLDEPKNPSNFAEQLGLKNLGISLYVLSRGEGFDFFHNHREQEEVYFCLDGTADLIILSDDREKRERIILEKGDIVRVEPHTLRAIGNESSDRALLIIAGACSHSYPAGFGHHDVIADVLSIEGKGDTGFIMPDLPQRAPVLDEDDDEDQH